MPEMQGNRMQKLLERILQEMRLQRHKADLKKLLR
jgi:hypothetical protein